MQSFVVSVLLLLCLVGSAQMQSPGPQSPNLLGNLLGGLGLNSRQPQQPQLPQQQPQQAGSDLLGNLLGSLSPNQLNSLLSNQGLGQNMGQGMLQGMSQAMNQMNPPQSQGIIARVVNGVMRFFTGGPNGQQIDPRQQMPGNMMQMPNGNPLQQFSQRMPSFGRPGSQGGLNSLVPAPLNQLMPNLDNLSSAVTEPLSQGRLPDTRRITDELSRPLRGLSQMAMRGQSQPTMGGPVNSPNNNAPQAPGV